jgi:hypothetical protein
MRHLILTSLLLITLSSCHLEKRLYTNGYYVHTRSIKGKTYNGNNSSLKFQQIENNNTNTNLVYTISSISSTGELLKDTIINTKNSFDSLITYNDINVKSLENKNSILSNKDLTIVSNKMIREKESKETKGKKNKDRKRNSFSWGYFWFITFSVFLTSYLLASPFVALFLLSYLIGFLIALHWYSFIKFKYPGLTKSILFQFFYWTLAPQLIILIAAVIFGF